uniref:DUF1491 family protein n=1 Tax=Pararhizobium sp. IMCC3301 TaxID=3067904 RepID=UPI0027407C37|nr:DUF1491 family protein [Pararhizobium sp. IMCC3301]
MAQRISSELWVQAYLRQCRLNGSFGYLVRRGATEAGAIFVKIIVAGGSISLYAPAPQAELSVELDGKDSRMFELILSADDAQIDARLSRERDFDPDIWIVEIEDTAGNHHLPLAV